MLSKKMEQTLNDQVKWEYYSGYLYLAMAAYFEEQGLAGFANWMHIQEQEERAHAERFYRFLNERGGRVVLQALDAPPVKWDSPLAVFQESLAHEQKVTARIGALMDLAIKEKDHATVAFLQWFISEQVEEEASVTEVIQKLKLVESTPGGWFMLDKDLALRVFTPPVIP
ncbi:MAG: ferritin [Desulfovibrionaceae bacterium]|nr:ferritin [Desulfovibrionaceae bacterium]